MGRSVATREIEVVFNFDTTGSMRPCIDRVKRNVEGALAPLFKEIPGLAIGIGANGDYCDRGSTYVTKQFDLTSNLHGLTSFVRAVGHTGGGDAAECYELVLREARNYSWSDGTKKVLVLIGDDVPHGRQERQNTLKLDWREEAHALRDMGITVYAVQCLSRRYATSFYAGLAELTGGYHLELDQFSDVVDLLMAVCYRQASPQAFADFEASVAEGGRMNRTLDASFRTMSGSKRASRYKPVEKGLEPVPPGRFQILPVDSDCDIKGFVQKNGLVFEAGRGYYEFTKTETIQEKKNVVLRHKKTGDMYTGDLAREMIGLPKGMRGRIKPTSFEEYDVFVQSTSYNRSLKKGTRFLYEVDSSR